MIRLLFLVISGFLFWLCIMTLKKIKKSENKPKNTFRADEREPLNGGCDKKVNMESWMEQFCTDCAFYDGHDICCNSRHWGTIIQNTVDYCEKENNYNPKYKTFK